MKKSLFFIIFLFSIFIFKNVQSNTKPEIIMECPGLKSFKNWCAGEYRANKDKTCIMISTPIKKKGNPPYKSRGEVIATIYHIPSDDSTGVIYITTGYTYKKDSIVNIKIDSNNIHDFNIIEGDTAFSDNESIDKKLIIEMKKGSNMEVIGFSTRGTKTTDIYSLVGFSAAYTYISNLCNVKN